MNIFRRFVAWLRKEGTAGGFLKPYEEARYTDYEKFALDYAIIIPPEAPTFADVSFYQARMDWSRYPHKSAIIRIGQNVWLDSEFEYNYKECKARGIKLGGYFFWDDRATPQAQFNIIKSAMAGKSFEMELFIDDEKTYNGAYSKPAYMLELIQMIKAEGIACEAVGIYTGFYWWKDNRLPKLTTAQRNYVKSLPLWLAWYASASVVQIPQPWANATHWQYKTEAFYWGQPTKQIDANRFVGTQAEFDARYGGTTPPPDGGIVNGTAQEILGKYATVRTSPGVVTGNDTGEKIPPGATVEFVELVDGVNYPGDKWLKLSEARYINQYYNGREYFRIISMPTTDPEPLPSTTYTATLRDDETGETWTGILTKS